MGGRRMVPHLQVDRHARQNAQRLLVPRRQPRNHPRENRIHQNLQCLPGRHSRGRPLQRHVRPQRRFPVAGGNGRCHHGNGELRLRDVRHGIRLCVERRFGGGGRGVGDSGRPGAGNLPSDVHRDGGRRRGDEHLQQHLLPGAGVPRHHAGGERTRNFHGGCGQGGGGDDCEGDGGAGKRGLRPLVACGQRRKPAPRRDGVQDAGHQRGGRRGFQVARTGRLGHHVRRKHEQKARIRLSGIRIRRRGVQGFAVPGRGRWGHRL